MGTRRHLYYIWFASCSLITLVTGTIHNCSTLTIAHGAVYRTTDETLQSHIMVTCHSGYELQGSSEVVCSEDKINSTQLPSCVQSEEVESCTLTPTDKVAYHLNTSGVTNVADGESMQVKCNHGYYMKEQSNTYLALSCSNGNFDRRIDDMCHFVGFTWSIQSNGSVVEEGQVLAVEKDKTIDVTCIVRANTSDGMPLPELTWSYPKKLRDYVEVHDGDSFIHTAYIDSMTEEYTTVFNEETGRYEAQGKLTIHPTMDVHSGEYTCGVKLINEHRTYKTKIKIQTQWVVAMWCFMIIPVILFIAIHYFYRNASINPFPSNKLTRDMMQEHDKKKKLDELRNLHKNPAYEKTPTPAGGRNHSAPGRTRRGAIDLL